MTTEELHAELESWLDARTLATTEAELAEIDAMVEHLTDLLDRRI